MGLELSPDMLAEAQRKADERGVEVTWVQGDMREFDLGRTVDRVFIATNSLLHLYSRRIRSITTSTPSAARAFLGLRARVSDN